MTRLKFTPVYTFSAVLLFAMIVGVFDVRQSSGQGKHASGSNAKQKQPSKKTLSTDAESLKKQKEDAARRESESLKNAKLWSVGSSHFTHSVVSSIDVVMPNETGVSLVAYCVDSKGNLLAACSGKDTKEVRVFSQEGKLIDRWKLKFAPLQITMAPNGEVYIAGHETLLVVDSQGKEILTGDCPYLEQATKEFEQAKKKLQNELAETIKVQVSRFRKRQQDMQEKRDALEKKSGNLNDAEKRKLRLYTRSIATFEELIKKQEKRSWSKETAEKLAAQLRARSNVCALSVTSTSVFLTAPSGSSYGFDIWRGTRKFKDWKIIRTGLSGCCGNMDVSVAGENLLVAENSKFRVLVLDKDGNEVRRFGNADRDGKKGFSGCCNPMNLCAVYSGVDSENGSPRYFVYTGESGSGLIKKFDLSGKLIAHVGRVTLRSGCKNVSTQVSRDGTTVYMLDLPNSKIYVLKFSARTLHDKQ